MWCPGPHNPADLLTKSGSTLEKINSNFWLHGSFLPHPICTWPTKPCASLLFSRPLQPSSAESKPPTQPHAYISNQLEHAQSFTKTLKTHCLLQKFCRKFKKCPRDVLPLTRIPSAVSSTIISCFFLHRILHHQEQAETSPDPTSRWYLLCFRQKFPFSHLSPTSLWEIYPGSMHGAGRT